MKAKRMLAIDRDIFKRLEKVCEENSFYRNSFLAYVFTEYADFIKSIEDDNIRIRTKERKARFQIYIDLDLYNSIGNSKTHKIEKVLDKVLTDYENNLIDFKNKF